MTEHRDVGVMLLAAGYGTRLRPLTDIWPKCLMPIGGNPLMEYWLQSLHRAGLRHVLVNLHHHAESVVSFLQRSRFKRWVSYQREYSLLGTAATLRANANFFRDQTVLLIHADNWTHCDLSAFLAFHRTQRPWNCPISMMTFTSDKPEACGIVVTDSQGVVQAFHEKVVNPPGNMANAAVYLLEPEVLQWLQQRPEITDFSTQVLPEFVTRIACWQNAGIHRDIGTLPELLKAQDDPRPSMAWSSVDHWQLEFSRHPIHRAIAMSANVPAFGVAS